MTWRLEKIAIYSRRTHESEEIPFNVDGLSLIVGRSATGKSSLLDIVNYGLLSGQCPIAKGVVRDHVSHVGLLLLGERGRLGIVRALPPASQTSTSTVFIDAGEDIGLPPSAPECRTSLDVAKDMLSEFTGIEAARVLTSERRADGELSEVGIRQCAPFLFQPQDVIASRNVTFPGLEDYYVKRHVLDAMDYFLRIESMDVIGKRRDLRTLLSKRRQLLQNVQERDSFNARGYQRGMDLWKEGVALGLVSLGENEPRTVADLTELLSQATRFRPEVAQSAHQADLLTAQVAEKDARQKVRDQEIDLAEVIRQLEGSEKHRHVTGEQIDRIRLRDLLPEADVTRCPLCGIGSIDPTAVEVELAEAAEELGRIREPPLRLVSRLEAERERLSAAVEEARASLKLLQDRVWRLLRLQRAELLSEEAARKLRFAGHAAEYVAAMRSIAAKGVDDELADLDAKIEALTKEVGESAARRTREVIERNIGQRMSALASELDVEFPLAPVRLNLSRLVIEVSFEAGRWVALNELGSGANWLSYHVLAAIALHQEFRDIGAPVPALLMLDQPSQAWFPVDLPNGWEDADTSAVERLYALLARCAVDAGYPQIVVTDHAHIRSRWFEDAIVREWRRHDEGLVPAAWIAGE